MLIQKNGVKAQTARQSLMALAGEIFPRHVISLCDDIGWPSYLTLSNLFLLGYLNSKVYQHSSQNLEALKKTRT